MPYAPLSAVARRVSKFFSSSPSERNRKYAQAANRATLETLESRTLLSAVISVTGNSVAIAPGDTSPIRADFTDFGPMAVKTGTAVQRTFTINDTGDATLSITSFKITGATKDFLLGQSAGSSVTAGSSANFIIVFNPKGTGTRKAEITILTNDPLHPKFTFDIQGTGLHTTVLAGGLQIATTQQGVGTGMTLLGQHLQVNYTGFLLNGTVFDSSLNSGRTPFDFNIGNNEVIKGWDQGLLGMKLGEKRTLIIPSSLAYGTSGQGSIPANATLIFEVQLLAIQGPTVTVTGNGNLITDGETTPTTTDATDFGDVGTNGTVIHTFTLGQTGSLGILSKRLANVVFIDGPGKSQFNITQPVAGTGSGGPTFSIRYQPTMLGDASATITVATNDPDHPTFTFLVTGHTAAPPPVDLNGLFSPKLVVPPQVGTGDTFNVPVSVTNWGWLVASGTVLITVEATTDGVWHDADPANPVIGSATPIISLGKHITNDYMVPVTIPSLAALPAATYKLVAKIQTVTNMGEINTADNFVTASQKGGAVSMKVVAALPDLTAAVGKPNSSRTVFIPGDSFQIPVTITNAGIRTANASVGTPILVDVRQGTSSTYSATDALIKQLSITNPIAPGKSVTMMVTVTIPHTGIPANFFVNANADSGSTVTEISETNNTAASAQITAGIQFGVFGKSGSRSVTFFDTDGTKVTMSLSKAGTGAVTKDGTGYHVTITGSNQQSELRISTSKTATPGDDGRFTINSLTVGTPGSDTTPLKSISATTTDVTGNFEIAGSVQTLDLGNFTGTGTLSVGAASFVSKQPVTLRLNAGTMQNVSLTSAIPITNMTVVNWLNTNSTTETVTAPYIETLNVTGNTGAAIAGDFQAGITTAGPHGVHTNSPTLNSVTIAGSLSGSTWAVTGQIGNVNVKGSVTNSTIAGTSINRINIAGDVTGTHFTATLPVGSTAAINSITIVGTMATSDLRSVGNINSITIGALNNSLIFAGVKNTVTGRPTATTDFTTPIPSELPKINSIVFTGIAAHATDPVLVNSSIAAGLIKTATLPLRATPVVSAGTGLTIFGFATRVGPVTHYTGPGTAGLYVSGDQALIT